jgi:hypothetical protein
MGMTTYAKVSILNPGLGLIAMSYCRRLIKGPVSSDPAILTAAHSPHLTSEVERHEAAIAIRSLIAHYPNISKDAQHGKSGATHTGTPRSQPGAFADSEHPHID